MSAPAAPGRIASMDQFRGYTVAGMFLVNFVGFSSGFAAIHAVLMHNDNYFSFADTIMPSFIFAVGFSYRLTILRRLQQYGALRTYFTYIKRSLALILVSLMVFGMGGGFRSWEQFNHPHKNYGGPPIVKTEAEKAEAEKAEAEKAAKAEEEGEAEEHWWTVEIPEHFGLNFKVFFLTLLKSDLWEVLSIIAVCQIFIMPVIAASTWVRLLAMIGCGVGHAVMTYYFNWDFQNNLGLLFKVVAEGADDIYASGLDELAAIASTKEFSAEALRELVEGMKQSMSVSLPDGREIILVKDGTWMDKIWGLKGKTSWDGGFFGIVSWSFSMLAGTLVYDFMSRSHLPGKAAGRLLFWGSVMMVLGYGMSCLTRLYDLEQVPGLPEITQLQANMGEKVAEAEKITGEKLKPLTDASTAAQDVINKEADAAIAEVNKEYEGQGEELQVKIEEINKDRDAQLTAEDRPTGAEQDKIRAAAVAAIAEAQKAYDAQQAELKTKTDPIKKDRDAKIKAANAESKPEIDKIKAEGAAVVAEIKGDYETMIAIVTEENKEGADRANKINYHLRDYRNTKYALNPVIPPFERAKDRPWKELLAEPPFVKPPSHEIGALKKGEPARVWNYWMLGKRTVNLSFITCSTGFAIFVYGLFVIFCDLGPLRIGLFRTFGMNPLAAYVIHEVTLATIRKYLAPNDAPLWYCLASFIIFMIITYKLVRGLEKQNIFVRM